MKINENADINTKLANISNLSFIDKSIDKKSQIQADKGLFEDFFNAAIGLMDEASKYELEAQKLQIDYIAGRTDDMIALSLAEQRAYTTVNFTVQVTNKIIDAYKQIMAIQI